MSFENERQFNKTRNNSYLLNRNYELFNINKNEK